MTPSSLLSAGIGDRDRVGELLGGVDAVAVADRDVGIGGQPPGACPAPRRLRGRTHCRASTSSASIEMRVHVTAPCLVASGGEDRTANRPVAPRARLVRRRRGRRQRLAERQPHRGDLLLLVDDDLLRDAPQLLVVTVAQLGLRHVDRALMMRHHHRDEVLVDVAGRLDAHADHHLRHRAVVLGQERRLFGGGGAEGSRADRGNVVRKRA